MKIKTFFSFLLVLLGLHHAGASPADEQKLAGANNTFAFNLLKQIATDQPASNIFISPYSASAALQMTANGAARRTKTEMQNALGTGATGLSDVALNRANKDISQSLLGGNPNVTLEIANSIWYRQGVRIKSDFLAGNREFFGATVAPLDFADPHSADIINQWASEKTHGRITHIADRMIDPAYSRLFLANAVYFKGKWSDPFSPDDTRDHPFDLQDGTEKTIPLMNKSKTFTYRRGDGYQAVRLPYKGDNLAMYVFLPDDDSSLKKLLGIINGDTWQNTIKPGFTEEDGDLALPKFKLDYSVGLAQPLKELGMTTAFDPGKADFSGMSAEQLYISGACQKTFVEVKEEGTEAAAVTGISMVSAAMPISPPKRFEMIVDHPFLFLIEDNQTGTILFTGVIYDPPADE